jgi:hypothetical protein
MAYEIKYRLSRILFGLVIFLMGLKGAFDYTNSSNLLKANIKDFNSDEGLSKLILSENYGEFINYWLKQCLNFTVLSENADELVIILQLSLVLGGLMCILGYSISKFFIISSIIVDLIFIHNLRFFATDSSKGLMLKYIVFIGGSLHIA